MLSYLTSFLIAFFGTLGFTILFNGPKGTVVKASTIGAIGWVVFLFAIDHGYSNMWGTFLGALSVGLIGEVMANLYRKPATVFIIPGIIPLVPGYGIYYTMNAIIQKSFSLALNKGVEAIFVAVAIATALIVSSTFGRVVRFAKQNRAL